ncbi:MAG TPA: alpha/beta hydrolase [Rhizomicrobium sp.]|nr:alpha/beta hydrolase [Rhizomicrobium sp.]
MTLRAAVGAQEPVTWIDAGEVRLAVMRRGRGVPVVCLHAIGHGARDFEDFARLVGDGFEIIALDWPGQGLSPPDGAAPTAAHYETVLRAAMDALKLERAILLGNSIGGTAALRLAAYAPERVTALVLCDTGGLVALTPVARFIVLRMAAFFGAGERGAKWFARAFRFYYRHIVLPRAPRQAERIAASGYEIAGVLRAAWEGFAEPDADIRALVPRVVCPVLVAWAKSDRVIAWSLSRKAARRFRDVRVKRFRGGHAAFLEDPERFARAFRSFAKDKSLV